VDECDGLWRTTQPPPNYVRLAGTGKVIGRAELLGFFSIAPGPAIHSPLRERVPAYFVTAIYDSTAI